VGGIGTAVAARDIDKKKAAISDFDSQQAAAEWARSLGPEIATQRQVVAQEKAKVLAQHPDLTVTLNQEDVVGTIGNCVYLHQITRESPGSPPRVPLADVGEMYNAYDKLAFLEAAGMLAQFESVASADDAAKMRELLAERNRILDSDKGSSRLNGREIQSLVNKYKKGNPELRQFTGYLSWMRSVPFDQDQATRLAWRPPITDFDSQKRGGEWLGRLQSQMQQYTGPMATAREQAIRAVPELGPYFEQSPNAPAVVVDLQAIVRRPLTGEEDAIMVNAEDVAGLRKAAATLAYMEAAVQLACFERVASAQDAQRMRELLAERQQLGPGPSAASDANEESIQTLVDIYSDVDPALEEFTDYLFWLRAVPYDQDQQTRLAWHPPGT
jgi:hypothetical protein